MGLINCPECGKEISDQAVTCPGCGKRIKNKKPTWLIVIAIICSIIAVLVLISAGKDFMNSIKLGKDDQQTITKGKEVWEFEAATDEELSSLPDQQGLVNAVGNGSELEQILSSMGVTGIDKNLDIGNIQNNNDIYTNSITTSIFSVYSLLYSINRTDKLFLFVLSILTDD